MRSFSVRAAIALLLALSPAISVEAQDLEKGISALQDGDFKLALSQLQPLQKMTTRRPNIIWHLCTETGKGSKLIMKNIFTG